jgi:hypothetical protein
MDSKVQERLCELHKQLDKIKSEIAELTSNPPINIPTIDIKAEVLTMSDNKEWKEFIIKRRVIENITSILNMCYHSYLEFIQEDFPTKNPIDLIGRFGSNKWLNFQLLTIKKLLVDNPDDDFLDTAGGCDEVAWDAGLDIIQEMTN